jgi:hypothetical protein
MQPHNDDQCPQEGYPDRRRNPEQRALQSAIQLALAQVLNVGNRQVHLAEPGRPLNLSASIAGSGGVKA